MTSYAVAEDALLTAAQVLAEAESNAAQQYLLYVMSGTSTYQAQKQADVSHGPAVIMARAQYEIALARLKRSE